MKVNWKSLFALVVMVPVACFAVLGCGGGSSETTVPDEAANVQQAPTDNPAEEPDMSEGP